MKLEQFDPGADEAGVRACHEIYLACHPIDDPSGPRGPPVLRRLAHPGLDRSRQEVWLARDGRRPRGWYLLSLPQRENPHLAMLAATVHPAHRRALGAALVRHTAGRARQSGRTC